MYRTAIAMTSKYPACIQNSHDNQYPPQDYKHRISSSRDFRPIHRDMHRRISLFAEKWLILGILLALVPFFQNMSLIPEEDNSVDIREIAPFRPEGTWDSPFAQYLPSDIHASSLSDVEQSILSHNFDPLLKDLELTYAPKGSSSSGQRSPASIAPETDELTPEANANWKLGVINPTKLRLMYSNNELAEGFQLSCEAESGHRGLFFRMSHPLSTQLNLGVTHETDLRQSQIQLDYRW